LAASGQVLNLSAGREERQRLRLAADFVAALLAVGLRAIDADVLRIGVARDADVRALAGFFFVAAMVSPLLTRANHPQEETIMVESAVQALAGRSLLGAPTCPGHDPAVNVGFEACGHSSVVPC
jgi:hypothetical protein